MIINSRIDLARLFMKKGFKKGAEIGVADGRYSEILCRENPGLKLYAIDLWIPYEKNWRSQGYQDRAMEQAVEKLTSYNVDIYKKSSVEASLEFKDGALDFVFIDGGHTFDDVMMDIILWSRKVRKGGIVSGHDYCHFSNSGVVEAVNKYCEIHRMELSLINRNDKNANDDKQPCWWFEKK